MLRLTLTILAATSLVAGAQQQQQQSATDTVRRVTTPIPRRTQKPPLHAEHWLAITGKPLSATAGAMIFAKGGNAVDAAAAMLAAGCTMWDTLSCGGETQALIYNPHTKKVIGINALGVAPTGATAEFYHSKGYKYPPEYGPLAAVTPGTPGGLHDDARRVRQAVARRRCSRRRSRWPTATRSRRSSPNTIERNKDWIKQWKYSPAIMLTHPGPGARGAGAGRDLRAEGSRRHVAQARRSGAAGAEAGQVAQAGDLRRIRPLLQGRHRAGDRARRAGGRRPVHDAGSRELEGAHRGAAARRATRGSRSTSSRSGSRGRRCSRRSTSSRTPT